MEKTIMFNELPSKGLVYTDVKEPLTIRTFRGKDEKIISEMTGDNFEKRLVSVLKGVLQGIDPLKLTLGDRLYLVLWEAINSYSKTFLVKHECPKCWESAEYAIDLSQIEIGHLPDTFKEPYEVKLPSIGEVVRLRLLRLDDIIKVDEMGKAKQNVWLYRYALTIVNDNGIFDNVDYLEKLETSDLMHIRGFHDKFHHGPKMVQAYECKNCGGADILSVPFRLEMLLPYGKNLTRCLGDAV